MGVGRVVFGWVVLCVVLYLTALASGVMPDTPDTPYTTTSGHEHVALDKDTVVESLSLARVLQVGTESPLYSVRPVGSKGHKRAQRYLKSQLEALEGFEVSTHSFTASTPMGNKRFTNIIASSAPKASSRVVLGAHYDSKLFDEFTFVAAVDSAVPCAMLIELGRLLGPWVADGPSGMGLDLVFFDGEEAFVEWTDDDSLYGSRMLATKWEAENRLASIEVMILLDLIGSGVHSFHNAHKRGAWAFAELAQLEKEGRAQGWVSDFQSDAQPYFRTEPSKMTVQDDHLPFLKRHVPIVHLIPIPFPSVWHTERDVKDNLDDQPILDLLRVLGVWLSQHFA